MPRARLPALPAAPGAISRARSVPCPSCGVDAGAPCLYPSGAPQKGVHGARELRALGVDE